MNSFNPELQLIEFAIRNKLIDLLSELKCFKFITTLVSQFKKIEIIRIEKMIKQNMAPSTRTQKQKQLLMKVTLMMRLN